MWGEVIQGQSRFAESFKRAKELPISLVPTANIKTTAWLL
jgi:hypothetical protein